MKNKCWWGGGEIGTLIYCLCECKMVHSLWKTVWWLFKKLNIELPYDPEIPLLGIHPKELTAGTQADVCTPMFIAALFIIQVSINRWTDKQNVEWSYNKILLSLPKWSSDTFCNMDEPWKHCAKWTKPDREGQILYDSTYMKYLQ